MSEREQLTQRKFETQSHFSKIQKDFEDHIVAAHKGKPSSTCHKCIQYRQGIMAESFKIQEIQKELAELGG